jgi:hypothetical protein
VKLVWHIVKKDLRRMAPAVALWVAFILGTTIWFRTASPDAGVQGSAMFVDWLPMMGIWSHLFTAAQFIIGFLLAGALILEDPLIGADAFWLTRPIANARLLVAKLVAEFLLFVVVPPAGLALVWLCCGFSVPEAWQMACHVGWRLELMAFFAIVVASLSRSLVQFLSGSIALVAVVLMTMARWFWPATAQLPATAWAELLASRVMVGNFVLMGGCALVVAWQFLTRKWAPGRLIIASVLVACFAVRAAWPWNTWAVLNRPETSGAVPPASEVSVETKSVSLRRLENRFRDHMLHLNAAVTLTLGKAANGIWYAPVGAAVEVTWENAAQHYRINLGRSGDSWADGLAATYLTGEIQPPMRWQMYGWTNASATPPSGEARISGSWHIWAANLRIMGELPMKVGGEISDRGSTSRVVAVESSLGWDKTLVVEERELIFEQLDKVPATGDWSDAFVLLNRDTKQAVLVSHNDLGTAGMNGVATIFRRLFIPDAQPGEEWRRGAVLVKIRLEPKKVLRLPFEARANVVEEGPQ